MSTTDEVLGSIDHALTDWGTSDDAMRWTPGVAPPLREIPDRRPSAMFVAFIATAEPFRAAMEKLVEVLNTTRPEITRLLAALEASERDAKAHAQWTAYRARSRRRTRSKR